jgi:adenosine deaminase
MDYHRLSKIELHLHLDCSLSYDVVSKINPDISKEEFTTKFIAPDKCINLIDYLTRSIRSIELMQTEEQLRLVTSDLFEQLKNDNVIYAEIRFAPLQHLKKGLKPSEVVQIVNDATDEAIKTTGVQAGIILCTLRHFTEDESMETVKLVEEFYDQHVCGFDIAADESFPLDNHIKAFEYAGKKGLNCTAHGGEARGAESVSEILDYLKAPRIGHGVRSLEDPELMKRIIKNNIHLEVCPTSNIQTDVFDTIKDHNLDKLYEAGVSMSINTDSRTITPVTLTHEYELLNRVFGWNKEHLLKCNLEAIKHAFTSDEVKEELKSRIYNAYK